MSGERFVIKPIQHPEIWDLYKTHEKAIWHATEIDFTEDRDDWENRLTDGDRYFMSFVLAFFAASDGIVCKNLNTNFISDVEDKWLEAVFFYSFQMAMENIHNESYSLQIEAVIRDPEERHQLFNAIQYLPAVKRKAEWALKWIGEGDKFENLPENIRADMEANFESLSETTQQWMRKKHPSFAERLVAFACVEGIFFSGSFCAIYWMKNRGLLSGIVQANELIARDEGLHQKFACVLYKKIGRPLSQERVHEIVKDAVRCEIAFIEDSLPENLQGMNAAKMSQYIKYVADRLCVMLGCDKIYNQEQPFDFMEMISLENKTNFFEKRVTEYAKSKVGEGANPEDNKVRFDVSDF
jgi:ribonucleoside-diphosphate reductase beta chain